MKKTNGFGLLGTIVIIIITAIIASIATGVIMLNSISLDLNGSKLDLTNDKELMNFIKVYDTLVNKYYDKIDKDRILEKPPVLHKDSHPC